MRIVEEKQFDFGRIRLYDNGIWWINLTIENFITVKQMQQLLKTRLEISPFEKDLLLVEFEDSEKSVVSQDVVDYLRSKERKKGVLATAYLGVGLVARLSIKQGQLFEEDPLPSKAFSKKNRAIEWLLSFRKRSSSTHTKLDECNASPQK